MVGDISHPSFSSFRFYSASYYVRGRVILQGANFLLLRDTFGLFTSKNNGNDSEGKGSYFFSCNDTLFVIH